jgi:Flp pilus assembly protein TadG
MLVGLAVIIGVLALGMDGGRIMEERRRAQATADAAALAGAAQLYQAYATYQGLDSNGAAQAAALQAAAANGYSNDGVSSIVTVNVPPQAGAFSGQAGYIEVLVQRNLPGTFAATFTGSPLTVKARAVAIGQMDTIGIIALAPSGGDAVHNGGNASLALLNGSIYVNSTDNSALHQDSNGVLTASSFQVVGGVSYGNGLMVGTVNKGVPPAPDPLATLPAPSSSSYTVQSFSQYNPSSGVSTIQPGIYQGGINLGGSAVVTMNPGVYILDGGGLTISGQAKLTGIGVMIYNTSITKGAGPININANTGALVLAPPTSGAYQGISIFQDRSLNQNINMQGNATVSITGVIYAPLAQISVTGNATAGVDVMGGALVARQVQTGGNGSMQVKLGTNYPRLPKLSLVE